VLAQTSALTTAQQGHRKRRLAATQFERAATKPGNLRDDEPLGPSGSGNLPRPQLLQVLLMERAAGSSMAVVGRYRALDVL